MFKKPFKIKSNNQIKSSERKNLKEALLKNFICLTEIDTDTILPKKELIYCTKIVTSDNTTVLVYLVQKRAIIFELNGIVYPTVYLLWKFNNILLTFTTTSFVVSKIVCGADLMLPGVVANPNGYGSFLAKHSACINSTENKSPIAIGVTAMSAHDLSAAQSRGKCVVVYHFYGDKLCSLEDLPVLPIPQLGPPEWLNYNLKNEEDFPVLGEVRNFESLNVTQVAIEGEGDNETTLGNDANSVVDATQDMDDLLVYCFLTSVKYSKTLELPILTSAFYKMEMMTACPSDKSLDIKKSSFKKVGQFLKHMTKEGVIVIKETKKGIEKIESIKREHPLLMSFYVEPENRPKKPTSENVDNAAAPNIIESYIVTNATLPFFQEFGLKKGDVLQPTDVRNHVASYVKNHNLVNERDKRLVNVQDQAVAFVCKNEKVVTWEELMEKVSSAMKACFKVSAGGDETVSKGKIQPITLTVQSRAGNKKVTLADNIELFGIRMSEFAKECQHGVAASTSISRPPGKKSDQLLIQGNQILFIYNLLIEKYKIPKKYIRGLEFAPKVKK